ncbi:MAG: hypothetical protein LKF36_03560 [Lactobacillus sp.]|jgi:hypothetical protein|nr:hypothetical protein [Lactobacillus sp.]
MTQNEFKQLLARFDHYFLGQRNTLYWLVVVRDHFDNTNNVFMYSKKLRQQVVISHELGILPGDTATYQRILATLKAHTQLRIEIRDTRHLINAVPPMNFDPYHGHG